MYLFRNILYKWLFIIWTQNTFTIFSLLLLSFYIATEFETQIFETLARSFYRGFQPINIARTINVIYAQKDVSSSWKLEYYIIQFSSNFVMRQPSYEITFCAEVRHKNPPALCRPVALEFINCTDVRRQSSHVLCRAVVACSGAWYCLMVDTEPVDCITRGEHIIRLLWTELGPIWIL